MQRIGPSLVFYLKYFDEIERLYVEEGTLPVIETRPDKEAIYKKIQIVGAQADRDAADLISACVADVQERLRTVNGLSLLPSQRSTVERNRRIEVQVVHNGIKSNLYLGVSLHQDKLTPWLWSQGGRMAERQMANQLGPTAIPGREADWESGVVTLPFTSINWLEVKDFQLDAEPVIAAVRNTFRVVTPAFVEKWLRKE